jgi:[ribosomal protein S18]-alanine N-acetyltransferase
MTDDIDRIMAVMEAAFDPLWGEAWTRRQVEGSLMMRSTHYRLLDAMGHEPAEDHPAAAFAMVRAAPGEEELLLIATVPGQRGNGLGARMIDLLAADARGRGATKLFLEMRENNPAVSLYERQGFVPIGKRRGYYTAGDGSRINAITFVKQL